MCSLSVEVCAGALVLALLVLKVRGGGGALAHNTLRVLVVNEHSTLGREVCAQLRAAGCVVLQRACKVDEVDALVVAGGAREGRDLHSLVDLVTAELYHTIKDVEECARRVKVGGRLVWVARVAASGREGAGDERDSFSGAADAFDRVMRLQLEHIALSARCEAVWLGRRCEGGRDVVSALLSAHSWSCSRGGARLA